MPYLKLTTNVSIATTETPPLLNRFSKLLAKQTGKPEGYVMVEVSANQPMMFAGSSEPLAYVECKSIGLTTEQANLLAEAICEMLHIQLQINPERVYIEFSDCRADFWGWNGSTFG